MNTMWMGFGGDHCVAETQQQFLKTLRLYFDNSLGVEEGHSLDVNPLNGSPLNERPLNERPLNERPLNERPLNERPLNERPLNERPLNERPLNERPLNEQTKMQNYMRDPLHSSQREEPHPLHERPLNEHPLHERLLNEHPLHERLLHEHTLNGYPLNERPLHEQFKMQNYMRNPLHSPQREEPHPLQERPLHERPLNEHPLHERPLNEHPLHERLLNEHPLHERPLNEHPLHEQIKMQNYMRDPLHSSQGPNADLPPRYFSHSDVYGAHPHTTFHPHMENPYTPQFNNRFSSHMNTAYPRRAYPQTQDYEIPYSHPPYEYPSVNLQTQPNANRNFNYFDQNFPQFPQNHLRNYDLYR
jgi:hypothetical protein